MAVAAREAMGKRKLKALADRGYFNGPEIKACEEAGITPLVPKPMTSNAKAEGRFSKADFNLHRSRRRVPMPGRAAAEATSNDGGRRLARPHVLDVHLPALPAQGAMHNGQRTAREAMGARGGDRSHAATA